jgi:hypothetical protein
LHSAALQCGTKNMTTKKLKDVAAPKIRFSQNRGLVFKTVLQRATAANGTSGERSQE